MAGVTLAAYLLPSAIGDASLAGLPPEAGLYSRACSADSCSGCSAVPGTPLSRSRRPSRCWSAPRSGRSAGGDPARQAALAACTALHGGRAGVRRLRRPRRRRRQFLLGNGARRLQVRRRVLPGEHAAAQAVRLQRQPRRRLLGSHGPFLPRPRRDQPDVAGAGARGAGAAARSARRC